LGKEGKEKRKRGKVEEG